MTPNELIIKINTLPNVIVEGRVSLSAEKNLREAGLFEFLIEYTSFLSNPSIPERLYAIQHRLVSPVMCCECRAQPVKFLSFTKGYRSFCSKSCQGKSPNTKTKRKLTNIERFGAENAFTLPAVRKKAKAGTQKDAAKEKRKKTNLEKYGVEHNSQASVVKEKKQKSSLDKYGTTTPFLSEQVKQKIEQTNLERYGHTSSFGSEEIQKKIKEKNQKKYGVDYYTSTAEFREKSIQTLQQKYGVTNPSHIPQVIKKIQDSRRITSPISKATYRRLDSKEWLHNYHHSQRMSATAIAKSLGVTPRTVLSYFRKANIPLRTCLVSTGELELKEFIRSLNIDIQENERTILNGKEIDIFIPSRNIGIEFNGSRWHSTLFKDQKYHLNKFLECKKLGVHLIQIYDYEWANQRDVVKNRLQAVLNVGPKVFARKCVVKELTTDQYKTFTNQTHLQGYAPAKIKLGLFYDKNLVAVMSFSRSRYTSDEFELIRYCSIGRVIGGASKLFSFFVKTFKPKSIVSYADRSWSTGALYHQLGFKNQTQNNNNVNYWYVIGGKKYHRSNFRKEILIKHGFSPALTEQQIMESVGALKIYGCGNYTFRWLLD